MRFIESENKIKNVNLIQSVSCSRGTLDILFSDNDKWSFDEYAIFLYRDLRDFLRGFNHNKMYGGENENLFEIGYIICVYITRDYDKQKAEDFSRFTP